MENTELWKDIQGYEGLYQISSKGRVKSLGNGKSGNSKERILKQGIVCGYCQVSLSKDGECKIYKVHRLVASHFLQNPNNYPCVNHKDEVKTNNCVENLEYCTHQYNNCYATRLERLSKALKGKKQSPDHAKKNGIAHRKPVACYNKNGNLVALYTSATQASELLNIDISSIIKCCKDKQKSCGNYIFKYIKKAS